MSVAKTGGKEITRNIELSFIQTELLITMQTDEIERFLQRVLHNLLGQIKINGHKIYQMQIHFFIFIAS